MAASISNTSLLFRYNTNFLRLFVRQSHRRPVHDKSAKASLRKKKSFLDSLRISVKGGAGGQGFPRYGGIGGDGGDVVIVASQKTTLKTVLVSVPRKNYMAEKGQNSRKFHLLGDNAEDLKIDVPVGVVIKTVDGKELGDLNEEGQEVIVAKGGKGGNPSNGFLGRKAQSLYIDLDLKLIADIALVGFPNAGKSTFLSAVSRANPKIAAYPFTTLQPQLGIIEYPDFRRISIADLPGLIEGAHINYGLGHTFLKHVERTKLLVVLVDINGFSLGVKHPHRTAFETILLLNKELELYLSDLVTRPAILVLNKMDTDDSNQSLVNSIVENMEDLSKSLENIDKQFHPQTLLHFDEIFTISAKDKIGLQAVTEKLRERLDYYAELQRQENLESEGLKTDVVLEETLSRNLV